MSDSAELSLNGQKVSLPVTVGTEKEVGIDITKLRAQTGAVTLDPGYANTGSCTSDITFIDGEKGILRYRGYPIEELSENSNFLEVVWLLLHGELPTQQERDSFEADISHHTMLREEAKNFYLGFPTDAHPMAVCAAVVGSLSTFYPDSWDPMDPEQVKVTTHRLVAKLPTIAAYSYKHSLGQPSVYPQNRLDYPSNFLHMMFSTPCEEYTPDPIIKKAVDLLFILHADHEQNCSASTVRMVGSSGANLFASISAGVYALWGPLHGGANQAVIEMLHQIQASGDGGKGFLQKVKDKKAGIRLMGFGHRVYKNFDPRARIIKKACRDVLDNLGVNNPLLDIAVELEEAALNDEYFVERKLYPNVDFYSGIIYQAIGIPINMFTVLFAIGRLPGWIAHWREMNENKTKRINRPRQIYTGPEKRAYVPIEKR